MKGVWEAIRREPVLALAAVQAGIVCGVAFGLDLSDAQTAGVLGVTSALLAIVARSQVSPVASAGGFEARE